MPHLPARSLVLLVLAFAASFSAGCATTDRAATEGRNALTIRGDFGELDVQGALTVGEEATIVLSPSKEVLAWNPAQLTPALACFVDGARSVLAAGAH